MGDEVSGIVMIVVVMRVGGVGKESRRHSCSRFGFGRAPSVSERRMVS